MTYPGYNWEYKVKKILEDSGIVLKLARWQFVDFVFIPFCESVTYLVECKSTKKEKYAPNAHDKAQHERLRVLLENWKKQEGVSRIEARYFIKSSETQETLTFEEARAKYFKKK